MKKKIIIVMDTGRFKAFRVDGDEAVGSPRAVQIDDRRTNVENHLSQELTDQAGQFGKGTRGSATAVSSSGERHNIDLEFRRRAVKSFAQATNEVMAREQAEEIYFAAGSEINQQALEMMGKGVRERIQKNLAANLTHLPTAEIMQRFYPPRRAGA
jgi:hypothetical protein